MDEASVLQGLRAEAQEQSSFEAGGFQAVDDLVVL